MPDLSASARKAHHHLARQQFHLNKAADHLASAKKHRDALCELGCSVAASDGAALGLTEEDTVFLTGPKNPEQE